MFDTMSESGSLEGFWLLGLLLSLLLVTLCFRAEPRGGAQPRDLYARVCAHEKHRHTHTHTRAYMEDIQELYYQHLRAPGSSRMSSVRHELIQTCVQARVGRTASVRTSVSPRDFFFFFNIFIYLFIFWLNSKCGFVNLHWFHVPAL